MFTAPSFAYISDGNVSLLVFNRASDRGPLVGWLWSAQNTPKELVAFELTDVLNWPFDAFTDDGRSGTLPLKTLFPPANSLLEWIPDIGQDWYRSSNNRTHLRVTQKGKIPGTDLLGSERADTANPVREALKWSTLVSGETQN